MCGKRLEIEILDEPNIYNVTVQHMQCCTWSHQVFSPVLSPFKINIKKKYS